MRKLHTIYSGIRAAIASADTFVITLGTSRVIRLKINNEPIIVAAGLGKPDWTFDLAGPEENVKHLRRALASIAQIRNGKPANVVFTVSPQRYLFGHLLSDDCERHEGLALVDNFYSKCSLRVAVEEVMRNPPESLSVRYFPALEIVYEEMRQFETLAHYDYCHISEQNTADLVIKKFLMAHASTAVLEQLSAMTRIKQHLGEIDKHQRSGLSKSDSQIVALVDKIDSEINAFGDQASAPLLRYRYMLAAGFGRALTKRFTAYPAHRGENVIAEARVFLALGDAAEARRLLGGVLEYYGPRRTQDPDAGLVVEHHVFNEAAALWNALPEAVRANPVPTVVGA